MKKIIFLIAIFAGFSLTLCAGRASALTMASSLVSGDLYLETLSITTTGTVVYGGSESTTAAYADSEDALGVLTIDSPSDNTIFGWTTSNENEAAVTGASHALSIFDSVYVDLSSDFDPLSSMFADIEAYADDAGNDGYADAWTEITGLINGGPGGGTITISVDYFLSIALDTSTGYEAGGSSNVGLELHGQSLSANEDYYDIMLNEYDGFDDLDTAAGTLFVSLAFAPFETGDLHLKVYSEGYAVPTGTVVPEPSTYLLLGSGIAGLVFWRRKSLPGKGKS